MWPDLPGPLYLHTAKTGGDEGLGTKLFHCGFQYYVPVPWISIVAQYSQVLLHSWLPVKYLLNYPYQENRRVSWLQSASFPDAAWEWG